MATSNALITGEWILFIGYYSLNRAAALDEWTLRERVESGSVIDRAFLSQKFFGDSERCLNNFQKCKKLPHYQNDGKAWPELSSGRYIRAPERDSTGTALYRV